MKRTLAALLVVVALVAAAVAVLRLRSNPPAVPSTVALVATLRSEPRGFIQVALAESWTSAAFASCR